MTLTHRKKFILLENKDTLKMSNSRAKIHFKKFCVNSRFLMRGNMSLNNFGKAGNNRYRSVKDHLPTLGPSNQN